MPVQRLARRSTGAHSHAPLDPSLDSSGWTPLALGRLLDLAVRLPFEEAAEVAVDFGLEISPAGLARLSEPYAETCRVEARSELEARSLEPLKPALGEERVVVLQADGVIVLGRPEAGRCPGVEVKSLVVYPQASPSERAMAAEVTSSEALLPLASGLLRAAEVRANDTVVAVSDGASWLEGLCQDLGVPQVIDVFHAVEYLETVMVASGWSEAERRLERRSWLRGEVNGREWLTRYLPGEARRSNWDEEARTAVAYLQARADRMDYVEYKARGWPIGSGQVEGMNKSVIGHRLKRSGQRWSRAGASRMGAWRAQHCSRRRLHSHDHLRRRAFPIPRP